MDIEPQESPLNVGGSESYSAPDDMIKLEIEADQALHNLRKSQEYEYKLAEERIYSQKNYLKNLYQQLKSEGSELTRPRSSNSFVTDHTIRKREEQIRLETEKLRVMMKVGKGFGSVHHDILREHFGVEISD